MIHEKPTIKSGFKIVTMDDSIKISVNDLFVLSLSDFDFVPVNRAKTIDTPIAFQIVKDVRPKMGGINQFHTLDNAQPSATVAMTTRTAVETSIPTHEVNLSSFIFSPIF